MTTEGVVFKELLDLLHYCVGAFLGIIKVRVRHRDGFDSLGRSAFQHFISIYWLGMVSWEDTYEKVGMILKRGAVSMSLMMIYYRICRPEKFDQTGVKGAFIC